MEFPNENFTITLSVLPADFSQKHSPETPFSRAVDSRYWETRTPVISGHLADEIFTSITTDDIAEGFTWH